MSDVVASVPFSEVGVRFGWTPWRAAGGAARVFDVSAIEPVQFDGVWPAWGHRKPFGGLWLSPIVNEVPLTTRWARWCEEHEEPHGPTVEVALRDSARVCVLASGADVARLAAQFPGVTQPPLPGGLREPAVDWVRLGEYVDAVYMTAQAEEDTKALSTPWSRHASGWWEIESMLVYSVRDIAAEVLAESEKALFVRPLAGALQPGTYVHFDPLGPEVSPEADELAELWRTERLADSWRRLYQLRTRNRRDSPGMPPIYTWLLDDGSVCSDDVEDTWNRAQVIGVRGPT